GGGGDREAALGQHLPGLVGIRALEAHHHRHLHADVLDGIDHAVGDEVATDDAAEDVDENGAHLRIGENELKGSGHALTRRSTTDVEEIGRLAAVKLDEVHRRHRQPCPVDHASDVTVERYIVEVV